MRCFQIHSLVASSIEFRVNGKPSIHSPKPEAFDKLELWPPSIGEGKSIGHVRPMLWTVERGV